jgi:hypothetical protein
MNERATTLPAARKLPRRSLGPAAMLLTVVLWTLNFGLIDLIDGFTGFVDQSRNQVLDAGWGAIFGVLLPAGLLAQVRRPLHRIAGLQQTAVVVVAIVIAALTAGEWRYFRLVAAIVFALAILLALHPARREFLNGRGSAKPTLALAGLVAAAPCLVYAARMTSAQRRHLPPLDAVTNGLNHWTAMAALALSVLLLVLFASLGTNGWRIPAWSAALVAAAWGMSILSAADAHPAGGARRVWAYAAIGWAAAVCACALLEARRESQSSQPQPHNERALVKRASTSRTTGRATRGIHLLAIATALFVSAAGVALASTMLNPPPATGRHPSLPAEGHRHDPPRHGGERLQHQIRDPDLVEQPGTGRSSRPEGRTRNTWPGRRSGHSGRQR